MEFRRPYPNSGVKIPENGFDYIIYGEDTDGDGINDVVYAKNGRMGEVEFKGKDLGDVVNKTPDGSSIYIAGGKYKYSTTIKLNGETELGTKSLVGNFANTWLIYEGSDVAILLDATNKSQRLCAIKNMQLFASNGATIIKIIAESPSYVSVVDISNIYMQSYDDTNRYKYGIYIEGVNAVGEANTIKIDNVDISSYMDGGTGIYIYGAIEITISNYTSNPYLDGFSNATYSIYAIGRNISMYRLFVDAPVYINGSAISIDNLTLEGTMGSSTLNVNALELHGNNITVNNIRATNLNVNTLVKIGAYASNIILSNFEEEGTSTAIKYLFNIASPVYGVRIVNMGISSGYTYLSGAKFPDGVKCVGGKLQNDNVVVFTGDGTTTTFSVAHGLVMYPASISTTPRVYYMVALDENAKGYSTFSADATYLYVTFPTALGSGSTATFYWYAEV